MKSSHPYQQAIEGNLQALWGILTTVLIDVDQALKAIGQGNQNGAVGSVIPTEHLLKQAATLIQAIIILHRQN